MTQNTRPPTAAEIAAYREGQRIRALMATPAYRDPSRRDPAVVAEVNAAFARAFGSDPVRGAVSPGEGCGSFGEPPAGRR